MDERIKVGEVSRKRGDVMFNDLGPSFVRGVITTAEGKCHGVKRI